MKALTTYIKAFEKLRTDRARGGAPHKPILLLSVLQAYQNNIIASPRIYLSAEVVALFKSNWNKLVITDHNCRISYPFYYLKSEGFWKLVPRPGFDNINDLGAVVKSFANLNAAVEYALIDNALFELAANRTTNKLLQAVILDRYFPATKHLFSNSTAEQRGIFDSIQDKILHEDAAAYKKEIEQLMSNNDEEEIFLRGSLFKREIPKIYDSTCCISGMRINSTMNASMIDTCHVIPFSESHDDTINNGIALCPNLHRAFDRGLIAIGDDYEVLINKNFIESPASTYQIAIFSNKRISLPASIEFHPSLDNFRMHRSRFNF